MAPTGTAPCRAGQSGVSVDTGRNRTALENGAAADAGCTVGVIDKLFHHSGAMWYTQIYASVVLKEQAHDVCTVFILPIKKAVDGIT